MSAYFDILELPKSAVEIKADLLLYKDWISLVVNVWGGPEFHLDAMDSLVDKDPDAEIIYVDDEYYTTLAGYGTELVYGIAISHKRRSIFVVFRGSAGVQDWQNFQCGMVDFNLPGYVDVGTVS